MLAAVVAVMSAQVEVAAVVTVELLYMVGELMEMLILAVAVAEQIE
jgi:hypothetical protein